MAVYVGDRVPSPYQITYNSSERDAQRARVKQKTTTLMERVKEEIPKLFRLEEENDALRPVVVTTSASAGGTLGFAVSYILQASRLIIGAATAGGAFIAGAGSYYLTKSDREPFPREFALGAEIV